MRVLYLERTAVIGGAERALLELLGALPPDVEAVLACPRGPLAEAGAKVGVPVLRVPGMDASFRLHPWYTTRALAEASAMALAVRRHARRVGADLVHANSVRAGLVASVAHALGAPPAVVHVRDCLPDGRTANAIRRIIGARAAAIIAVSRYAADSFGCGAARTRCHVLYGPIQPDRFDPAMLSRGRARSRLGIDPDGPLLAMVAQITPWKAQHHAIGMLAGLREAWPDAKLLLVGEAKFVARATRYDNRAYMQELRGLVRRRDLEESVVFMGERDDVPAILAAADLALMPSLEEPFGRAVAEAMAMETAVIATNVAGPAELITDGVDGVLLPAGATEEWVRAADSLLRDHHRRMDMGIAARKRVESLTADNHAREAFSVYREVVARSPAAFAATAPSTADRIRARNTSGEKSRAL